METLQFESTTFTLLAIEQYNVLCKYIIYRYFPKKQFFISNDKRMPET